MKKSSLFLSAILVACLTFFCSIAKAENASVCIDPGHGGGDPGAVGNGLQEKNLNLTAALAFRDWLELDNSDTRGGGSWDIYLTRDTDVFISLSGRADYANGAGVDYFMSIHANAGGGDGTETYAYRSGTTADRLAHRVQEEVLDHLGTRDRGVKYASFSVLVNTAMPADLTEMAFIDVWTRNAELLADDSNLDDVGLAHLHALQRMVGLSAYTPSVEPTLPDPEGSIAFVSFPEEVEVGSMMDIVVSYETNLHELDMTAQLVLEVKDAESWDVLDEFLWNNDGQGIQGPSGEFTFSIVAPNQPDPIFFVASITPRDGTWDDRYGDASTLDTPTTIFTSDPGEDSDLGHDIEDSGIIEDDGGVREDADDFEPSHDLDGSTPSLAGGCSFVNSPNSGFSLLRWLSFFTGLFK